MTKRVHDVLREVAQSFTQELNDDDFWTCPCGAIVCEDSDSVELNSEHWNMHAADALWAAGLLLTAGQARKIAAFEQILSGYASQGVDDMDSDWMQGSFYDNAVTQYLKIPTLFNTVEASDGA